MFDIMDLMLTFGANQRMTNQSCSRLDLLVALPILFLRLQVPRNSTKTSAARVLTTRYARDTKDPFDRVFDCRPSCF